MEASTGSPTATVADLYEAAEKACPEPVDAEDVLTEEDRKQVDIRIARYIDDFNARHGLDVWDYAIAGGAGLLGAMLDLLCVNAPAKPTLAWTAKVDGLFNQAVQVAFKRLLPPEVSAALARANKVGSADASTIARLIGAPPRTLNPRNHRLRSLSHDPVLGLLFGIIDMTRGTCTVVGDRGIEVFQGTDAPMTEGFFASLGRMFGHLLSAAAAPSQHDNRGMGLPAPFMGILRMFHDLPIGGSDLGRQVEYMYVNGYDFRQFVTTSIPALILEVVMRVLYGVKQVKLAGQPLGHALLETMPARMNPRFRLMLALGYGCLAAVNGGRVYLTKNIMNLNDAAWMGFVWHGFHAARWVLLDRGLKIWNEIERQEAAVLEETVKRIEVLESRAERLPVRAPQGIVPGE